MRNGMGLRDFLNTLEYTNARTLLPKITLENQCILVDTNQLTMCECDRLDTDSLTEQVYSKTIFAQEECSTLTTRIVEVRGSSVSWELQQESVAYVIEGSMNIAQGDHNVEIGVGQVFFAPQSATVKVLVSAYVKILLVTPAVDERA